VSRLPLCSSAEIVRALQRAGFQKAHSSGSHQTMEKQLGGKTITTVVPLAKHEVARGTLRGILRLAAMSQAEFRRHLRS
jgi:predicted RNA binding protein YcfA (HicA-like mRNA interferase family)